MYGLQVRLDLVAFVLIFAQLIAADTYALPPMTSLVNQCFDGPLGAQVCVQVNKTGCLAMSVGLSLNDVQLLNEERSIAQLVQDIKLNNSATLPLSYCKNVDITLTTCNACIEVKSYRMTTQSRTIELSGSVSVTCPGDINQSFKIDGLRLDDCFWVCPNDCTNGVCSVDGKCQCNAGYYGPDCSIHEQNNCYNGTIFPNNNLCIQYSDEECRLLIAHAVSSGSTVYNHYYNIMNITHPANRNKHYPIFHSNNAAISPGCRATIYAYRYVIDAYIERVNPPLKHCRAVDYECQGHKDLLIMGTYPIGQCSDTVIVVNQTRCNPPTPKPPMVREPISHGHFPPIPPTPPVAPPRSGPPPRPAVPSNQEPIDEVEGESSIGKNVVIALAVLVGAGILAAGAYVLYKRWKQRQQIEMIGEYVTEDIFDSDDDEELVTLEPQPGLRV